MKPYGSLLILLSNRFRTSLPQQALENTHFCSKDIFATLTPPTLVSDVLDDILSCRLVITSNTSLTRFGGISVAKMSAALATHPISPTKPSPKGRNLSTVSRDDYQALACRILIQGQGIAAGPNERAGRKSALAFLVGSSSR